VSGVRSALRNHRDGDTDASDHGEVVRRRRLDKVEVMR